MSQLNNSNHYNNINFINNNMNDSINSIKPKKDKVKSVSDYKSILAPSDKQMTKMGKFIQRHYILVNVLVIGLFLYCYYLDVEYKTFSMRNWVTKVIP